MGKKPTVLEKPRGCSGPEDGEVSDRAMVELRPYLPPVLYQWPGFVERQSRQVATLFIDVAGFTQLSERLAGMGPEGAEILERTIALYFGALLTVIEQYDGFPINVAGDALSVIFGCEDGDLKRTVHLATECADRLKHAGEAVSSVEVPGGTFSLGHKIGVGVGTLISGPVGDPRLRTELAFAGDCLDSAAAAEHRAQAGQVWASPAVVALVEGDSVWSEGLSDGFAQLGNQVDFGALSALEGHRIRCPASLEDARSVYKTYEAMVPEMVRLHAEEGTLKYISRHQNLTVMFVGCPAMTFGDAESLQVLDAHYRQMQQVVTRYGGFICEFEAGDKGAKLIVLFGAPEILEEPCMQAVRCARDMQTTAQEAGIVTDQRIGITTGRLYVGRVGCPTLVRFGALGDRMNLAARLMSKAGAWKVYGERHTVELTSSAMRWTRPRKIQVKGKRETVVVSNLMLTRTDRSRERRGGGIVGRRAECRRLTRRIQALKRGEGGLVQLVGEAGVGKTRLVEALTRPASRQGVPIVRWHSTAEPVSSPLMAWRPVLLSLMGASEVQESADKLMQFMEWRETLAPDLRRAAELLTPIVDIPWEEDPVLRRMSQDRQWTLMRQSLTDLLLDAARSMPQILVFDTAERLDLQSARVILELVPHLAGLPLFIVVCRRPTSGERAGPLDPLSEISTVDSVILEPLQRADVAQLAERRLKVAHLDSELLDFLINRSHGSPLLIEAWIDFLLDHGSIHVHENSAFLSGTKRLHALPDRLESLVLTQLARLTPKAQLSVGVASIVGATFTPEDVARLHPECLSEEVVGAHLKMAAGAGLLHFERGKGPWMFFSRQEIFETIHDSLNFQLRRQLHLKRAQQLLERLHHEPQGDMALALARHYEFINEPDEQKQHFLRAVDICDRRYDHRNTVRWARRMIEVSDRQDDREGFLKVAPYLKKALELLGEDEERRHINQRWIQEAEEAQDTPSLVHALRTSARSLHQVGEKEKAQKELERALQVARSQNDPVLLMDTLNNACSIHCDAGRIQAMAQVASEAIRICPKSDPGRMAQVLSNRGAAYQELGRMKEAFEDYQAALALTRAEGDVMRQAIVIGNLAVVLWALDKPEEGHARLLEALELKRQVGDRREIAMSLVNAGYSFYRLGDFQRAKASTEEGLRHNVRMALLRGELDALSNLGGIHHLLGELDDAARCFQRAEQLLLRHPHRSLAQELHLRRGELALTSGEEEGARAQFQAALELAGRTRHGAFECNALEGLAEADLRLGDTVDAMTRIAAAVRLLESGGSAVDFPQRVFWRAWLVHQGGGDDASAWGYLQKAVEALAEQQCQLSEASRARIADAFPWNRAILETLVMYQASHGAPGVSAFA